MKRELWVPVAAAGLALAFAVICALVWLTRGRPSLVKHKLRIGALLLTLTAAVNGCGTAEVMCYAAPPTNYFSVEGGGRYGEPIDVHLDQTPDIKGTIHDLTTDRFWFRLLTPAEVEVQRGELVPVDGAFDHDSEEAFTIELDSSLSTGRYTIEFLAGEPGVSQLPLHTHHLNVIND